MECEQKINIHIHAMIQYIARSANHPLTLWPWGKDMSAARVQSNSKYYPRDWFDKWMWILGKLWTELISILPENRNYLEHDQSDISGSMFAKLLQILSEMCEFCVAIWCGVNIYCHGSVIWCSLCYPAPAKYLSNRSNLLSHSPGWGGWSLLKHSEDALDNRDNARRLC